MRVEVFQKLMTLGNAEIDPLACPTLYAALKNGYCKGATRELPTEREKEEQHPYVDFADAASYLVSHAFRFVNVTRDRTESVRIPEPMEQPYRLSGPIFPVRKRGNFEKRMETLDKGGNWVETGSTRRPVSKDWKAIPGEDRRLRRR
jgi:hypothetical protein